MKTAYNRDSVVEIDPGFLKKINENDAGIKLSGHIEEGTRIVIFADGFLDNRNSSSFTDTITSITNKSENINELLLDLSRVTYISSAGIGSLTQILMQTKLRKIDFYLGNLNKKIKEVIDMLGFTNYFRYC